MGNFNLYYPFPLYENLLYKEIELDLDYSRVEIAVAARPQPMKL